MKKIKNSYEMIIFLIYFKSTSNFFDYEIIFSQIKIIIIRNKIIFYLNFILS